MTDILGDKKTTEVETATYEVMNKKQTSENLNSMLDVLKKGNVPKEKMELIVNYVLKLAEIEGKYNEQKEEIKAQVRNLINSSLRNYLESNTKKYNISKFDVDGQEGLDKEEEVNYGKSIQEAITQIVILGGFDKFTKAHSEDPTDLYFGADKFLADKVNLQGYDLLKKDGKNYAEKLIQKAGNISETELKAMQERDFDITSSENWKELGILLVKEFGNGFEDVLRFLTNVPSGILLIPRYTQYRVDSNSLDEKIKTTGEIKLKELIEENPSLGLLELLGEKGLEMLNKLGEMMISGKQGDMALTAVTIAGLLAGGAGAVKLGLNLSRKVLVMSAKEAGRGARVSGKTSSRLTRNKVRDVSNKVAKVGNVLSKVDDIVGGAGFGHLTGNYSNKSKDKIKSNPEEELLKNEEKKNLDKDKDNLDKDKDKEKNLKVKNKMLEAIESKNSENVEKLLEEIYLDKEIIQKLIESELGYLIPENLEKIKGINLNEHLNLAYELIKHGHGSRVLAYLDDFKGIKEKEHLNLAYALIENGKTSSVCLRLDELIGILPKDHLNLLYKMLENGAGEQVFRYFDNFEGIKQSEYLNLAYKAIENGSGEYVIMYPKFLKGIDTKYYSDLVNRLMLKGKTHDIINYVDKIKGLGKLGEFLKKMEGRRSDIYILDRYQELSSISGFKEIFNFYIENRQSSLIPMLKKVLMSKDIGLNFNFQQISNFTDISWLKNAEVGIAKEKLESLFDRLSSITGSTKSKTEFTNFLKHTQVFDDNAINSVKIIFSDIIEGYFDMVYNKHVKLKIINDLGLKNIPNIDEILKKQEIIEGFKMYQIAEINKPQFKQILENSIKGKTNFNLELSTNKKWLESENIKDKDMGIWQTRNEKTFNIEKVHGEKNNIQDIKKNLDNANDILKKMGLEEQDSSGNLLKYFNMKVKKNINDLSYKTHLNKEEFDNLFERLSLHITEIKNIIKQIDIEKNLKLKEITEIKIYKENNPSKILMMGELVDNSCLSVDSTVISIANGKIQKNNWSTATNALDINKGVFFIQDQNGNIIGRVLTAIDNEGKIMRFKTYKKGNIEVDLDKYFNEYIKLLAEKIGLGLNGDIDKVELLNGEGWYKDPVVNIK